MRTDEHKSSKEKNNIFIGKRLKICYSVVTSVNRKNWSKNMTNEDSAKHASFYVY